MWKVYFQEKIPFLWNDALEFPAWLLPLFYCWKSAPFVFGLGAAGFVAAAVYSRHSGDVYYNALILKMGFWFISLVWVPLKDAAKVEFRNLAAVREKADGLAEVRKNRKILNSIADGYGDEVYGKAR
ncbi:hypothetical protein E308F_25570 [Moorella sp. E308F]|uniref:hypothetical protein n=1 Tax=Moorella sp. E308F TaxID=2572682 RepID=UPI0010FFBC59|nr:hypothetical protein [Moorella sp. E308F]GEA16313.1 hypothetical protein E308F_25570 [Moorella sp. E308F]